MKAKTMIVAAVAAIACAQSFGAGAKAESPVHWEAGSGRARPIR